MDISQNINIPLPPSLQITRSILEINPKSSVTDYYNNIILLKEIEINQIYYVRNVGSTNTK